MEDKMFDLMTKMYQEMIEIKSEVVEIKSEMNTMKENIATKHDLVCFENKMDEKLTALFDGYTQNTEKTQSLTVEIADLKEEVLNVETLTLSNRSDIIKLKRIK